MANSGSILQVDIDDEYRDELVEDEEKTEVPPFDLRDMDGHGGQDHLIVRGPLRPKDFSMKVKEELLTSGPEVKLFPPKMVGGRIANNPRNRDVIVDRLPEVADDVMMNQDVVGKMGPMQGRSAIVVDDVTNWTSNR